MMGVNKKLILLLSLFPLALLGSVSVHAVPPGEEEGFSQGISRQPSLMDIAPEPEEEQRPAIVPRTRDIFLPEPEAKEIFSAKPLIIGKDIEEEEISAMRLRAEEEARSSGRSESYFLPVLSFDNNFEWGQKSTNITPQYLESMGDYEGLIAETGGAGFLRMLGTAKFLYIVLEAMDDPGVKGLTGPQMEAKAEAALAQFVTARGGSPGALTPDQLAAFGNDVKAQILKKSQPEVSPPTPSSPSILGRRLLNAIRTTIQSVR